MIPTANQLFFSAAIAAPERERLENEFFRTIRLRNGTFKTTYHRRLDDLNELVVGHLPPDRPLRIMDVAVSSGVSTAEWMSSLVEAGVEHQMVAGDSLIDAFLICATRNLRVLVDRTGHLLQVDVKGKAIPRPSGKLTLLRHLGWVAWSYLVAALVTPTIQAGRYDGSAAFGTTYRSVKLVTGALQANPDVVVVEDDILTNHAFRRRFDVLRAANILNLAYFDRSTLERMIRNLGCRLRVGGVLIVCRTDERNVNNASVFVLRETGEFRVVARLNAGSEVEDLVLDLRTPG